MGDRDFQWAVNAVIQVADALKAKREGIVLWLDEQEEELRRVAERLAADPEYGNEPFVDIVDQMPINSHPNEPTAWWMRDLAQIRGITIHHTMSHDPVATAKYLIGKGRPSGEYHFWISVTGECWLCVPLAWGCWHDHTGHKNAHVSIGMAGSLHKVKPPMAQLQATVRLVRWLMAQFNIPLAQVRGHCDRYSGTICPGWDVAKWRGQFFTLLEVALAEA
jgi:hypothetical protein